MTTNDVTIDSDTVHAAGVAIHNLDTSRRVGWAKAFEAIRRADSAERDLNMIRSDTDLFRKFSARAFGALIELVGTGPVRDLFDGDCEELRKSFPDGAFKEGQRAARNIITRFDLRIANNKARIDEFDDVLKTVKKEIKTAKGELTDIKNQITDVIPRAQKTRVINEIVDEFGFFDRKEFWDYLNARKA